MINLIPPEGGRTVRREYILRVAAVWSILFSAALLAFGSMLFPTYVLLNARLKAISQEYDKIVSSDTTQYQEAQNVIRETNLLAAQLHQHIDRVTASDILSHVESARSSAITLRGFEYGIDEKDVPHIEVRGMAVTRESLVAFTEALERDPLFSRASVPVSDLAKDSDLTFTATLTLRDAGQ